MNKSSSSISNVASFVSMPDVASGVSVNNVVVSTSTQAHALSFDHSWHLRLGHMPFSKITTIPFLSKKLPKKQSFMCSICPMARQ